MFLFFYAPLAPLSMPRSSSARVTRGLSGSGGSAVPLPGMAPPYLPTRPTRRTYSTPLTRCSLWMPGTPGVRHRFRSMWVGVALRRLACSTWVGAMCFSDGSTVHFYLANVHSCNLHETLQSDDSTVHSTYNHEVHSSDLCEHWNAARRAASFQRRWRNLASSRPRCNFPALAFCRRG